MIGAPALVALGAFRSGAGLVRIVAPRDVLPHAIAICPSATGIALEVDASGGLVAHEAAEVFDLAAEECDCIAIGPGLGTSDGARALCLRAVQQEDVPVVVDADALTNLAVVPELSRDFHGACILTPHPGEFRRLAAALNIEADPVHPGTRPAAAEQLAQRLGCIVVLKGAGSVVTDGHKTWVCEAGHPCLATAGTGDVLTGVLAGLAAQFRGNSVSDGMALHALARARLAGAVRQDRSATPSLLSLARVGVWCHASAGQAWAAQHQASAGALATDVAELIPPLLERARSG